VLICRVDGMHTSGMAEIHWEGSSREVLGAFPEAVRGSLGFALYELQLGREPSIATRRMESIGAGVYELKEGDEGTWYRVVYLSRIDDVIYVLHCFEKQGRKISRRDLNIARERLSRVRQRIQEERKHASGRK
jgi:phage-related protein